MSEPLTDLEAVTLGCVANAGPCTAYKVRRQFQTSPSARYSGSAGAIYPLLRRLEDWGLVSSREAPTGKRPASEYSITREGRNALRAWLRAPMEPRDAAVDDPLRTRMLFLAHLPPAARRTWIDTAGKAIRSHTELIDRYVEAEVPSTLGEVLAGENARQLNRARLRWLAEARERWG